MVADDEIIKVHVHTERPGEVMNYGQRFGSLMKVKSGQHALATRRSVKTDYTAKVKEAAQNKKRNTESWQLLQVKEFKNYSRAWV